LCNAFSCTPSEALELDPRLVYPIMEYRLLQSAKDQQHQDASKMSEAQISFMGDVVEIMKDGDINA
jgi:hypothetical protein